MFKLGIITGTNGTDGTMYIDSHLENDINVPKKSPAFIGFSEKFVKEYTVNKIKKSGSGFLLKLEEIISKEIAFTFKEQAVFLLENVIVEKTKKYYEHELQNCQIFDIETGELIGNFIKEIINPGNDLWVINSKGNDIFIPVNDEFIKKVDVKAGRIEIKIIPGLLDLNIDEKNETKS